MKGLAQMWLSVKDQPARRLCRFGQRLWRQWRVTIFVILFVVVPVKSSLADWNWVPTGSMNPTILEGDLIYVDKVAYDLRFPLTLHRLARWSEPQRGDVVVCLSPDDGTRLVKRLIAAPGDTVELRNNVLLLNGRPLTYDKAVADYAGQLPDDIARVHRGHGGPAWDHPPCDQHSGDSGHAEFRTGDGPGRILLRPRRQ